MKQLLYIFIFFPIVFNAQEIISEDINMTNGEIKIPGTLSYLKTNDKVPLVIFVHGSGNIDRNGNQAGTPVQANYIKTLSDSLITKEIAFYRYDKRTATPENMAKLNAITLKDFANDVKVVINHFKNDPRFSSIHLIGHSQGSLVAMLAITDDIKSYISIAGAGESIDKTIVKQLNGQSPELAKVAKQHIDELMKTDTIVSVNPFLISLFAPQNQKFWKNWMLINPEEEIKKITIPILIINGESDLQVKVSDAEGLKAANPKATLVIIPKMNHVMKVVDSIEENQQAYIDEKYPLSSILVHNLSEFIKS
tara:strand:+ start:215422 stop:216348 length:927 start_codon:yes stop_codon:yes gene_type:complete